jgi:hypothetical protein
MRVAAGLEVLTGLALIVAPSTVARFLFGSDLNATGEATGRLSGFVCSVLRPAAGRVLAKAADIQHSLR